MATQPLQPYRNRADEIARCERVLGAQNFKPYHRRGNKTTAYTFTLGRTRYVLTVPLQYPKYATKLSLAQEQGPGEPQSLAVTNFNGTNRVEMELLAQINFLNESGAILQRPQPQYRALRRQQQSFYKQFAEQGV
ncbi:Smu2p KNAG_0L02260 [Huiozyma naganishii CBS 8797]|uniref:Uncharacterized protein n=1 Tax=Huiozyma naganishii (strain ATCC MYA-139 / BCRC 22969 / CBS 8797 / KCTC 17520 / NBRC 10181 / NCYC 3082 / Yp74L-3) TaxID=1071383 RepID=J7S3V4_HUIN7|nr:hypothetical protein KNAG_0L02260 [Kazachstania naganishii CBS 8797]CCK72842.1 hypothetical protein KNAG_0L02260 [Kazachstania naganishii CBS 8797]